MNHNFNNHLKILSVINNGNDLTYAEVDFYLRNYDCFVITTWDGQWCRNIYIPAASNYPGRTIYVESASAYQSIIIVNGNSVVIQRGQRVKLYSDGNTWIGTWGVSWKDDHPGYPNYPDYPNYPGYPNYPNYPGNPNYPYYPGNPH